MATSAEWRAENERMHRKNTSLSAEVVVLKHDIALLRARIEIMTDRQAASMISMIIEDEIGGEVCTKEWSQAAADRIVCALRNAISELAP